MEMDDDTNSGTDVNFQVQYNVKTTDSSQASQDAAVMRRGMQRAHGIGPLQVSVQRVK